MIRIGQPSFFDSDQCLRLVKIWQQVVYPIEVIRLVYNQDLYIQQDVMKKSRKSNLFKSIKLGLGKTYLYHLKPNGKPHQSLGLVLTKMDLIPNELGFRLTRNQQVLQFHLRSKEEWLFWKSALIKRCFQSTFHESFAVVKMIGKGSFAKVYLATKKETNVQYAIKAFNKEFMQEQAKGKESLQNEISVMRQLNHPNLTRLYEVYETQNSIYFVLDIISGGELLQRIKQKGPLNQLELQTLSFNLLKALAHIHSKNCAHRDLKPENLLLRTHDDKVDIVLADFGLATFFDGEILFKRCGTPGFVAPEILRYKDDGDFYDLQCDVFSAGIIIYILLTGKQPFQGADYKHILRANKACEINFALPEFSNAPLDLQDLLIQMLDENPKERISSMEALRHNYFGQLADDSILVDKTILQTVDEDHSPLGLKLQHQNSSGMGSMELQQRQACQNGRTDTIGSLSNSSNSSISQLRKPSERVVSPKCSQFSNKYGSARTIQTPFEGDKQSPISNRNKQQHDLYRQAIKNSQFIKQREDIQKQLDIEDLSMQPLQFVKANSQYQNKREISYLSRNNSLPGSPKNSPKNLPYRQQKS